MPMETDLTKILFSAATIVAVGGYLLDRWLKRYDKFKDDVYGQLDRRVKKDDCKDLRERYQGEERRHIERND